MKHLPPRYSRLSLELVRVDVYALASDLLPVDMSTLQFAVVREGTPPGENAWHDAVDVEGFQHALIGPPSHTLAVGVHDVYARLTAGIERPVLRAGSIEVY